MALAQVFSVTRADLGTQFSTPQTRGLVFNGMQTEQIFLTKAEADTSGTIDLTAVRRPNFAFLIALSAEDSNGDLVFATQKELAPVAFTHSDNDTIAVSGLGEWTSALLFVCGRSYA